MTDMHGDEIASSFLLAMTDGLLFGHEQIKQIGKQHDIKILTHE